MRKNADSDLDLRPRGRGDGVATRRLSSGISECIGISHHGRRRWIFCLALISSSIFLKDNFAPLTAAVTAAMTHQITNPTPNSKANPNNARSCIGALPSRPVTSVYALIM